MATIERTDIWVLARELALALETTPEIQEFRESEDDMLNDEDAIVLVKEYEEKKRLVKHSKNQPQAEQLRLIEEFMVVEERYNTHPVIQRQWAAREAIDQLMERVNAVVTWPITGTESPKPKGGACGSATGGGCGSGGACSC